jgi:hypothetical protein
MRGLLAVVFLLLVSTAASAEERRYAVLSMIGDQIELVSDRAVTGSGIPQSARQTVKIADSALDRFVVRAVDRVARSRSIPDMKMMAARDPALFALQEETADASDGIVRMLPVLKTLTDPLQVTHLIVVSRYRHDALIRMYETSVGHGKLSGIGFYIDHNMTLRDRDSGQTYVGYLATYAYLRVSLVDLAAQSVMKDETVLGSYVHTASPERVVHPWESASESEKTRMIQRVLQRELERVVPAMLR